MSSRTDPPVLDHLEPVPDLFLFASAAVVIAGFSMLSSSESLAEQNKPRKGMKRRWSLRYKRSIDCSRPKGFSQKNYCKRKERGGHYLT